MGLYSIRHFHDALHVLKLACHLPQHGFFSPVFLINLLECFKVHSYTKNKAVTHTHTHTLQERSTFISLSFEGGCVLTVRAGSLTCSCYNGCRDFDGWEND